MIEKGFFHLFVFVRCWYFVFE